MDTFLKTYIHLIYESNNKPSFNTLTIEQYKQLFKNVVIFSNIITEDKDCIVDIPLSVLEQVSNNKITAWKTIYPFFKQSNNWSLIQPHKKCLDIAYCLFHFDSDIQIGEFNREFFNLIDPKDIEEGIRQFKKHINADQNGFYLSSPITKKAYLCVNKKYYTDQITILYHQLTHYLQEQCRNIFTNKNINFTKNIKEKLVLFDLPINKVIEIFNKNEFTPHLDDLIRGLNKTYNNYYKDKELFFNEILNFIKNDNFKNSKFWLDYQLANNGDCQGLIFLKCSTFIHNRYLKILKKLKEIYS